MDFTVAPHVAPVVHHVAHHVNHAAATVAVAKPVIAQGYSMLTLVISNLVSAAVAGGAAWYVKGRGMAGVQIDMNNIKTDIENIKAKVFPVAPVATPTV